LLENEKGPFVAVSEWMRIVPQQIERWVPGGLYTLGTDGFGRSESRAELRNFFETSAEHTVLAVLNQLAKQGQIKTSVVDKAIKALGIAADQEFALNR
jgi:pyruvate dehydrogenase E1 component